MSILIKGMKMPSFCLVCPCSGTDNTDDGNEVWVCEASKLRRLTTEDKIERRPEWCPLVEIPPHGRLIDANELLMRINHEVMEAYMDGACYGVHPSQEYLYLLGEIIDDAPTVIEAEEGET